MTAAELADLTGLLAFETAERARAGDSRDKTEIATAILAEADAPEIGPVIGRITRMIRLRGV